MTVDVPIGSITVTLADAENAPLKPISRNADTAKE